MAAALYEQASRKDPGCGPALWEGVRWTYQLLAARRAVAGQAQALTPDDAELKRYYPAAHSCAAIRRICCGLPDPGV